LGIKFDASGTAQGYHVYRQNPGEIFFQGESVLIPASDMIHVYSEDRPGQIRGVPIMAPVILRLYDLDTFEQAELQKQEVASLFAGFRKKTPDVPGGGEGPDNQGAVRDRLEPGTIEVLDEGEDIVFSNPPQRSGYAEYVRQNLMAVAAGVGLTYEAVSGDYGRITFLNGRLGQLRFHRKIDQWQWFMLIPQLCRRVAEWFREGAAIAGQDMSSLAIGWQPPVKPMVDPEKEIRSTITQIRAGLKTQFEAIAEHGNDPVKFLDEYKAQIDAIDERKLVFVTDARKMSGAEQLQPSGGSGDREGEGRDPSEEENFREKYDSEE
ncbi:MAG: phage portal protein, partial [Planctomycetota bacterium]|nr:phage portal protein [Planctomycetota bacterium]